MMLSAATLIEHSPDGVLLHDGERIVAANASMLRLVGATHSGQVVGRPVASLFERPYLKCVQWQLLRSLAFADRAQFVHERLYDIDGHVHDVESHAQLFFDDDRPMVFLVVHDITARVRDEQRAREREELERATEERMSARQMAGGIAHVLNNRLQIILGFANILAEEPLSREQHLDLQQITRAAADGADVTRQLLQVSGGASYVPESVELAALIPGLVRDLAVAALPASRPVSVDVISPPAVWLDKEHVRYMLRYLVDNARRATCERGQILVEVRPRSLDTPYISSLGQRMERGMYATITVQDTGSGIAPEAQFHMFEPFFTTTRIGDGNGLGLSAVQGLLLQNHGFLTYTSALGVGSTFTLWFPVERSRVAVAAVDTYGTVLVVDDHSDSCTGRLRALRRVGYEVLQATTPLEASEILTHTQCPALIIVGPSMGARDVAALTQLRARCPTVPLLQLRDAVIGGIESTRIASHDVGPLTSELVSPFSDFVLLSRVQALISP